MKTVTYHYVRQHLENLIDELTDTREPVCIEQNEKRVIMIDAEDFENIVETAYLLRSPVNAERLMRGLDEFRNGKGVPLDAQAVMDAYGYE